jgi:hypothetical protein
MASNSSILSTVSSGLPGLPLGLNWLILGAKRTILFFFGLPRGFMFLISFAWFYPDLLTLNALVIMSIYPLFLNVKKNLFL